MKIGIVADDLTGAMDAAAPFADLGVGTSVALDAEAGGTLADRGTSVVSVDVHTRDSSPERAAAAVRSAMAKLLTSNQRLPFKKIDSTLRGNIGAETIGALVGSGRRDAIISPAAPQLGRQLREGRLLVHGESIGSDDLVQILRAQLPGVPVHRLLAGEVVGTASVPLRLLVADAEEDSHLDYLVDVSLARPDEILLVGSSGLAAALARRGGIIGSTAPVNVPNRCRRILFVVGSRNSRSAAQVRSLLANEGVADFGASVARGARGLLQFPVEPLGRLGVVYVTGLEEAPVMDSQQTAEQLAEVAASLVTDDFIGDIAIVMTGGETARTTLERLGVRVLAVSRSLAPGVVLATTDIRGRSISIVTKAGGFGDSHLFTWIASQLLEDRQTS